MPTYILLMRASEAGSLQVLHGGRELARRQKKAIRAVGGTVLRQYPVTGRYDMVTIVDLPDEVVCLAVGLALNAVGFYTEALRAYTPGELDQARKKVASIGKRDERKKEGQR